MVDKTFVNSRIKLNFKNVVFWYNNSLDTSELKDTGSIRAKALLTSFNKVLLGEAVKYLGRFSVNPLVKKYCLYKFHVLLKYRLKYL